MNEQRLRALLDQVRRGEINPDSALEQLRLLPVQELGSARLDHHRSVRTGLPEAVFAEYKSAEQLITILRAMLAQQNVVLATRVSAEKAALACRELDGLCYHPVARILTGNDQYIEKTEAGLITLVTAGTSDIPVAEEARITLKQFGHATRCVYDAGVAGIHRILAEAALLQESRVVIVIAGMEGALPSVVAGMTPAPVIAVPTSVGYGAGAGGYAALLGVLNSCAPGLAVVNIDNGFGAACMAAAINRPPVQRAASTRQNDQNV